MSCLVQRTVYAGESCHCFLTSRTMVDLHHVRMPSDQLFFCQAIDMYIYLKRCWQLCFFICCLNNNFWSKARTLVIMCTVVLCYIIQLLNSGGCCNCVLIGVQHFCLLSLEPLHNNLMFWLREHWPQFLCLLTFLTCHCTPSLLVILDHF